MESEIRQLIAENKPDMERQTLLRREIEAEQNGKPDLEIMSASMKSAADQQWSVIQAANRRLGKFSSIARLSGRHLRIGCRAANQTCGRNDPVKMFHCFHPS